MAPRRKHDDWHLAPDSGLPALTPPPAEPPPVDRSAERLNKPLHTLTAEHCGWLLLAAYAIFTRLAVLTIRPLDAGEAARALDLLGNYNIAPAIVPQPGWVSIITWALFTTAGASDWCVRIVPAVCGLLMIAMAYRMRRYLGRAGALALACFLTLSPGFTYYSRAYASAVPSALAVLVALHAFCAAVRRPSQASAGGLGAAIGLTAVSPPGGPIAAISFIVVLTVLGLYRLIIRPHALLSVRIWFRRYRELLLIAVIASAGVWFAVQVFDPGSSLATAGGSPALADGNFSGVTAVSRFYLPVVALDEFLIAIAAAVGLIGILSLRIRSEFATAMVLWTLASVGLVIFTLPPHAAYLPIILLPMAFIGAIGIEWLHHRNIWPAARIVFGVIAIVTAWVQINTTFIYYAPDASEAAWNRHASLYWPPFSTTIETETYCQRAMTGIAPKDATVNFKTEASAIRWYLRDLRPIDNPAIASVIVSETSSNDQAMNDRADEAAGVRRYDFDYAMSWPSAGHNSALGAAVRYILESEAWVTPIPESATITVRSPSQPVIGTGDAANDSALARW